MARSARSKEVYGRILLIAVTIIVMLWISFLWEASTGLTIASRRSLGENSTPKHLAATRRLAIGVTCFFGPIALWCFLVTREKE